MKFFFFQAEDGIRDWSVTGVQTCALPISGSGKLNEDADAAWSDAAKAMSRKLRPTDSIYRLGPDIFALVLPETDALNAKRVAVRLQEELQDDRTKYGKACDTTKHNNTQDA